MVPFGDELAQELYFHITKGVAEREKAAEERHSEMVKVNKEGWMKVATAIRDGLGAIARAVEGRR